MAQFIIYRFLFSMATNNSIISSTTVFIHSSIDFLSLNNTKIKEKQKKNIKF